MAVFQDAIRKVKDVFSKHEDTAPFIEGDSLDQEDAGSVQAQGDGEHLPLQNRPVQKPWLQLARLSGTVCGIEFCYAAETAFVSPILLRIGIAQRFMTMVWCLSPLMGFIWMPILGSASDRCGSRLGRRRPFILLLSTGIIIGLLLVPNGYRLGTAICGSEIVNVTNGTSCSEEPVDVYGNPGSILESISEEPFNVYEIPFFDNFTTEIPTMEPSEVPVCDIIPTIAGHTCGLVLTVIGIVLLDFNCDACQSPARAYLIDVTHPADHVRGLSMFSFMAGLGGSLGYIIGGIPWHESTGKDIVGAQIRFVFGLVLIIFVVALVLTVTAEKEKTLYELFPQEKEKKKKNTKDDEEVELGILEKKQTYGSNRRENIREDQSEKKEPEKIPNGDLAVGKDETVDDSKKTLIPVEKEGETQENGDKMAEYQPIDEEPEYVTMKTYLLSIIHMPWSLRILCCTHLLGWMSLLCYSLYFTDFVGQAVYGGDPYAEPGSPERYAYAKGVRMGSYAMGLYSFTCAICSFSLERMIKKVGAKPIYVCNHLVYSVCMACLALIRTKWAIFVFSASAGVQYSTLFTLPFILLARYHSTDTFSKAKEGYKDINEDSEREHPEHSRPRHGDQIRGLGTDVAVVQSMVFVAQFFLSLCMGSIVQAVDSTVAVVVSACILSFLGSLMATQVLYAGL
ncbi:Membrane-associated transporter protein [Holothuria leucospilota]|uniref:Membrane-associated transporter protein n=1 Tax=Holothuria leucospilota TaxID=206669 RepID=A0A9Q1CGE7_HOLLE|nr:Membrane-associated transporter protein [Holothuria leucospilota]